MRRMSSAWLAVGVCLIASPVAAQSERPQAVSPGSVAVPEPLGTSCPTFSWSGVVEATGYELVVYRVAESGELEPVLEMAAPRGATSWTPSATQCPSSQARYAWAVRAVGPDGAGAWSEALLFETATVPSGDEVRRALRVLRRYAEMVAGDSEDGAGEGRSERPGARAEPQALEAFRERDLRPGLQAIRRQLNREARMAEAAQNAPSPQAVTLPASFSLAIDGDFDLGGSVFKDGVPFLHDYGLANTALGRGALEDVTPNVPFPGGGIRNTAIGYYALSNNTSGSSNTAVGLSALRLNTTGPRNTAVGYAALLSNKTGQSNTATGHRVLLRNTDGGRNTATGYKALYANTEGNRNTAAGHYALRNISTGDFNTAVGDGAGYNWTTGNWNIALGRGAFGMGGESATIRIGGSNYQGKTYIEGISGTVVSGVNVVIAADDQLGVAASSARFKQEIRDLEDVSGRLLGLRPVSFRYRDELVKADPNPVQFGLIAEEVAAVFPELVAYDDEGRPYTVRYQLLTPLLLHEIQRLEAALREQRAEFEALRGVEEEVVDLRRRLDRLAKKKRFRSP